MSRRRYISTTISIDKVVNALATQCGDFAALFYTWMISHAEDDASITGDPNELLWTVTPGRRDRTEEDVIEALTAMDDLDLICWDREGARVYFDSESFYRHQSYIPEAKRADNSEHFRLKRESAKNAEERRTSPQNAASLSPSLSPSPTRSRALVDADAPTGADKPSLTADFESWWAAYGKVGDKADARDLYLWWRTTGKASADDLLAAARNYRAHCLADDSKMKHARTFLAKPSRTKSARWPEWANGEEHGHMDAGASSHLSDVLTAGAKAFGFVGDDYERHLAAGESSTGAFAGGQTPRRGLPAGELATGQRCGVRDGAR